MGNYSLLLLFMISATKLLTCLGRHLPLEDQVIEGSDTTRYSIVFDVSSSRTKMEIYKINVDVPPIDVTDVQQLDPSPSKVKPGIADLAGYPTAVEGYLKPLLDSAKRTVPEQKHKSTPLFFLATAGMRLLSQEQANDILDEARRVFSNKNKCPFMFNPKDARIISGAFEGIYAWVTVNFLLGNFIPGNSASTYGILDVGGASHQNTFENPGTDAFPMTVGGKKYDLFARSYLGYGMDQARKQYLEFLSQQSIKTDAGNDIIKSPCHHKGFEEQITIRSVEISLVGTASVDACRSIIQKTFFCTDTPNCPFYDQPRLHGDFYAFSGIFYVARDTGMICSSCTKNLSTAMFDQSSRKFCAKRYEDVSSNPYAKNVCFESNYIYELLTKGYDLSSDKMIQVGNELGGFSLGWTLGAMLKNSKLL